MRSTLVLSVLFTLLLASVAHADLAYTPASGWKSSDNSLESRLSQGLENPQALQLMNEASALYARGKDEKARTTFRDVAKRYPASLLAPEAFYQIGKIRIDQGKVGKAYEAYANILKSYPNYQNFDQLLKEMFSLAERISSEKGSNFLGFWKYTDREEAINAFEKIVTAAPYSDYAPRALFVIARLYKEKGEELSAIDAYERLIGSYPNHPLAPDAYYALATTYRSMIAGSPYDQGATQQAIRYYQEFSAQYPSDPRAKECEGEILRLQEISAKGKYEMAIFYIEKRNNRTAGANLLKEAIQAAPESQTAQKAQKMLEKMGQQEETTPAYPSKKEKSVLDRLLFWKN